jgi:hypothetical protein
MRTLRLMSVTAISLLCASAVFAAPLKLTPATPQPGGLKSGLSVSYAYATEDQDFTTLSGARSALKANEKRGKPLRGLDYRDTNLGENSLTSTHSEQVAASISGYIRFDNPGLYTIDFFTNDGLLASIGGQQVGKFNGRQTCDTTFATEVEVPSAGWYKLSALYFNRLNTSCLMMRWAPKGGAMKWVPNNVFGRK